MKPVNKRIFVKQDDAEAVTKSGIIIPHNLQMKPFTGTVVSMGSEVDIPISIGDRVYVEPFSALKVNLFGKELIMMQQDDVIAVFCDVE